MLQNPLAFAIAVAVLYGIGGPLMKIAMDNGASHTAIITAYGVACLVLMAAVNPTSMLQLGVGNNPLLVVAVGFMLAFAFWFVGIAFSLPGASPTVIMSVVASYPLINCLIEIVFKLSKVDPWRMSIGATVVVVGIIIIASAQQQETAVSVTQ